MAYRLQRPVAVLAAAMMLLVACADGDTTDDETTDEEPDEVDVEADEEEEADDVDEDADAVAESEEPPVSLEYAHALPASHPYHECGVEAMPEMLDEANVNIELTTFADGAAYGSTAEQLDALVAGELAMTLGGPGQVAAWDERVSVLDALYLWEDGDELKAVLDGPIGDELWDGLLEESGLRVLGLGLFGNRHLTANVPVTHPDDMAGLQLRVVEGTIYSLNGQVLGGDPTPVAFPELYTALQQGVVDAQENPLSNIEASGFEEVQDYLMLTDHLVQYFPTVIADQAWQELSDAQQEALQDAVDAAMEQVDECQAVIDEEILAEWRADDSPIEVIETEDIDIEAFRERAQELYPGPMADDWGDLYDRLLEELEEVRAG